MTISVERAKTASKGPARRSITHEMVEAIRSQPPSLFVPKELQEAYFTEKGIRVETLPNGITILGVAEDSKDSIRTEIETIFTTGAWTDRMLAGGKPDVTHFLEHMFFANKNLDQLASDTATGINGFTTLRTVNAFVSGVAIPNTNEIGIWSMLKPLRDAVADPLGIPDVEKYVEIERKRIIAEIAINQDEERLHENLVANVIAPILYDQDNVLSRTIKSSERVASVNSITLDDLKAHAAQILNPKNMIIDIYTEGSPELLEKLIAEVRELYSDFPHGEKPKVEYPHQMERRLNPDFKAGKRYEMDTETGDEMTVILAWPINTQRYTKEATAAAQASQILSDRMNMLNFEHGWGYTPSADAIRVNDDTALLTVDIKMPMDPSQFPLFDLTKFVDEEFVPIVTSDGIKNGLSDEALTKYVATTHALQKALPISADSKSQDTLNGLINQDKILNVDALRELVASVSPEDIAQWRDVLLTTPPAIILAGNFSKIQKTE